MSEYGFTRASDEVLSVRNELAAPMNPDHVLVYGTVSDLPSALRPTFVPPAP
ncbi:hypothetical protein ACIBJF_10225 [Streptomyces sp. NPDC050743]|uniref:hypothetical protein n=1 Tax=Streptomyces sp. NPDC050743 TaxID=3365634 RepID=UPI00378D2C8B